MPNEEMNPALGEQPNGLDAMTPTPTMDNTETSVPKPKEKIKDRKAEEDLYNEMLYSPTSGDADPIMEIDKTTDEEEEKLKPDTEELLDILEKGKGRVSDKYRKELLDLALKDPTAVMVETPRGWMTVRDAIGDGFNLVTGDFTDEPIPKVDWEGEISKLDPRDQQAIRNLTRPGTRQAGPSPMPPQEGGDVIPGPTGEALPPQAGGVPVDNQGALGEASMGQEEPAGGTEIPLGGV